ncbi:MAG: Lpg1974 family pore-forming outer membrane protein [Gammaproteobacteria bacterium]|jgi:hypothetical protein
MKRISKSLLVFSFTSLTILSPCVFANLNAYAPEFEGGFTFSIGTFYAAPGSDTKAYAEANNTDGTTQYYYPSTQYDWGFEAAIGYVFDETANGIELSYRGLNSTSDDTLLVDPETTFIDFPGWPSLRNGDEAINQLTTQFDNADLLISQFLDIGYAVQMRFVGGLAYTKVKQNGSTEITDVGYEGVRSTLEQSYSQYEGWGPRIGIDARYDFDEYLEGFGVIAGGSVAYFFGELNSHTTVEDLDLADGDDVIELLTDVQQNTNNHAVLNLRGNVGIDYVFFFDDEEIHAFGIELGYLAEYYQEAINQISTSSATETRGDFDADLIAASFMGPYVNIKGVF